MPSDIAHERRAEERAEHLSYLCEKLKRTTCNPLERLMQAYQHDEAGEGTSRVAKRRRVPKCRWEKNRDKRWESLVASMIDDRWAAIPTEVIASAILYMHRYFKLKPNDTQNEWVLPVTSLWLACKVVTGDNQFPVDEARTMERHYAVSLELLMVLTQPTQCQRFTTYAPELTHDYACTAQEIQL